MLKPGYIHHFYLKSHCKSKIEISCKVHICQVNSPSINRVMGRIIN